MTTAYIVALYFFIVMKAASTFSFIFDPAVYMMVPVLLLSDFVHIDPFLLLGWRR